MKMNSLPYRPCVGVCVVNREGKIFGGRRIDMPSDAWQMPQGGVDEGEAPEVAALRELGEETGISANKVRLVAVSKGWLRYDLPDELIGRFWGGKYRGQRQKWYLFQFEGADSDINIETEHPEFSEWDWKTAQELIDAIVPFKKDIYEQVLAGFAPYLK